MANIQVQQDQPTGKWFVAYRSDDDNWNSKPGQLIRFNADSLAISRAKLPTDDKTLIIPKPSAATTPAPPAPPPLFTLGGRHAQITIAKDVWSFDDATRARVRTSFDAFLVQLEAIEGDILVPGATGFLRRELANLLPATFDESLYFNYGFARLAAGKPVYYVDLQPGMRLRLDHQFSQFISPANAGAAYDSRLNGFVGAGQSTCHVVEVLGSDGRPQLDFDAFLAANSLSLVAASAGGVGGLIDLHGTARRYVRLCYPPQLPSSDSPGYIGPRQNVSLIGANDLATLAQATNIYYSDSPIDSLNTLPGVSALFFRGRVTAVPEIICFLNDTDTPWYVPVGTTLRQLIQRFAALPRLPRLDTGSNFQFQRYVASTQMGDNPQFRDTFVGINIAQSSGPGLIDGYDLPLLATDLAKFQIGNS